MTSLIDRFFRKKPSRKASLNSPDISQENLPSAATETGAIRTKQPVSSTAQYNHLIADQLLVGVAQSVGMQRDHNEDALFSLTTNLKSGENNLQFGLYIVADGMGGHENGEIASSLAVEQLVSHVVAHLYLPLFSNSDKNMDFSVQEVMHTGIIQAHQTIKKEVSGGGTTLTAALIMGDQMTIAHVGDSRAYLIDLDSNLRLLTHDHSLVKRLVEIGQISPEEASTHPQRNVLYRALGQGEPLEPDIATFPLQPGSQLLLCTDGLWGVLSESELTEVICTSPEPQTACQTLMQLANSAGGPDNITAILVRMPG